MPFRGHGKLRVSWWSGAIPPNGPFLTATTFVGMELMFNQPGRVMGFAANRGHNTTSAPFGIFWNSTDNMMLSTFGFKDVVVPTDSWQQTWVHPIIRIDESKFYRLVICFPGGGYSRTTSALAGGPVVHNGIEFRNGFTTTALYPIGATVTLNTNANGIDVLFLQD